VNPNYLQVWEPGWGAQSSIDKGYTAALDALTAKNAKAQSALVTASPYPDKFLTAAAAGTPPDLIFCVTEQDLAYKKLLVSIDGYMQTAKLSNSDFFPTAMEQSSYKGHLYMLPLQVDPNFPLVYNKSLLQQAGIDKPPSTINELDDANQKLYQKSGDAISRLGILPPWRTYGAQNSLYTYFLMFGGGWFDPGDQNKLAITQAGNANALGWIKKFADQFGGYAALEKYAGTWGKEGYPAGVGHGLIAMGPMVSANYTTAVTLAKGTEFADSFAVGLMPVADGVTADPAWLGGWAMGIPTGVKRPDDSWAVLQWMAGSADGTDIWAEINGFLPGFSKSPFFDKHANDAAVSGYIKVLQGAHHPHSVYRLGWPDVPNDAFNSLLANTAQGKTDIQTALQQFETVVKGTLDKYANG